MSDTRDGELPAMACRDAELSLGALVLGAIDPAERLEVEAHVSTCERCRSTLAELAPLPGLLNRLEPSQAEAGLPEPPVRLLELAMLRAAEAEAAAATTPANAGAHRHRWLVAAVAAAAVVLASVAVLATRGGDPRPPQAAPTSTASGTRGDTVLWNGVSTDGDIRASVLLTPQASGARLSMTLSGVRPEQRCDLVIWSTDGEREVSASWQATYAGEATVTGSTSVTPQRIRRMVVASPEGDVLLQLWKAP